jgi:hypothetical protein
MERAFAALKEATRQIPRDTFDPKAIVERIGRDPQTWWIGFASTRTGSLIAVSCGALLAP